MKIKKMLLLVIACILVIGLAGCGEKKEADKPKPKPKKPYAATDIMKKLKKDYKMPIVQEVTYTEKTDPNQLMGRPDQYTSKCAWNDKRDKEHVDWVNNPENKEKDGVECTIEVCDKKSQAKDRDKYLRNVVKNMPMLNRQYIYYCDRAVMRVSFNVIPKEAKKYQKAFEKIVENW